jgi:hypothetical protein
VSASDTHYLLATDAADMVLNPRILKAYINHFLPREVVGPVLVVFSLEGVIDGIFNLYVPDEHATLGWGVIFLLTLLVVAYWGSVDEVAVQELQDRFDEIEAQDTAGEEGS